MTNLRIKSRVTIVGIVPRDQWQLHVVQETRRDERADLMAAIDQLNRRYGRVVYHASEKLSSGTWRSSMNCAAHAIRRVGRNCR